MPRLHQGSEDPSIPDLDLMMSLWGRFTNFGHNDYEWKAPVRFLSLMFVSAIVYLLSALCSPVRCVPYGHPASSLGYKITMRGISESHLADTEREHGSSGACTHAHTTQCTILDQWKRRYLRRCTGCTLMNAPTPHRSMEYKWRAAHLSFYFGFHHVAFMAEDYKASSWHGLLDLCLQWRREKPIDQRRVNRRIRGAEDRH